MTHEELVVMLKKEMGERSQRQFAHDLGVSAVYLGDVLGSRRQAGRKFLKALKMSKTVTVTVDYFYEKKGR